MSPLPGSHTHGEQINNVPSEIAHFITFWSDPICLAPSYRLVALQVLMSVSICIN